MADNNATTRPQTGLEQWTDKWFGLPGGYNNWWDAAYAKYLGTPNGVTATQKILTLPPKKNVPVPPTQPWEIAASVDYFPLSEYPEPPYEVGPGFTWIIKEFDENGKPIEKRWVSEPVKEPETGKDELDPYAMSDYEKAMLELQKQQLAFEREKWGADRETPEQLKQRKWEEHLRDQVNQRGTYDQWKAQLLSELNSPRDWVKRWFLENTPNPNPTSKEIGRQNQMTETMYGTIPALQSNMESAQSNANTPWGSSLVTRIQGELNNANRDLTNLSAQVAADNAARSVKPAGPPVAPWMARFVNQGVGTTLANQGNLVTPGAQDYGRLNTTQWQALGGVGDYWGQDIADVMKTSESMIPTSGAGKVTWRPTAQR